MSFDLNGELLIRIMTIISLIASLPYIKKAFDYKKNLEKKSVRLMISKKNSFGIAIGAITFFIATFLPDTRSSFLTLLCIYGLFLVFLGYGIYIFTFFYTVDELGIGKYSVIEDYEFYKWADIVELTSDPIKQTFKLESSKGKVIWIYHQYENIKDFACLALEHVSKESMDSYTSQSLISFAKPT
jgi:hypothetical protein